MSLASHPGQAVRPLVSVSMITFNHEPFIEEAIRSVLAQEVPFAYELIIGEDCSSDRTRAIVRDYAATHSDRIRVLLPDRNLGNRGLPILAQTLAACRGDLIARLDGDDYWTSPLKLQEQVKYLDEHPDCSMCFHNVLRVFHDGSREPEPYNPPRQRAFLQLDDLFDRCPIGACSPLIRRDAILPLPEWFASLRLGDWPLYMMAARHGRIGYMEGMLGAYRVHDEGLWSGADLLERADEIVVFLETVLPRLGLDGRRRARSALAYRYFRLAQEQSHRGDLRGAQRSAMRAIRTGLFLRRIPLVRLAYMLVKPYVRRLRTART